MANRNFGRRHSTIFLYSKTDRYTFNIVYKPHTKRTMQEINEKGEWTGKKALKGFSNKPNPKGVRVVSWWTDIAGAWKYKGENQGYPTQKPLKLYDRIIKASSNEGDTVLDPFCGSGTTLVAAKNLNRQYIGVDKNEEAIRLSMKRLRNEI